MKQRIFFGLAPLFILLVAIGVYAVTLFAKLGGQSMSFSAKTSAAFSPVNK